jgi:DNA-directed RNA polymerase subunit alpha
MKKFLKTNITAKLGNTNEKGTFIIKPLERGFGITLGNALRRILLSTIPGTSIFAVKIKGATHEFQAISGVKEDSMNLILNLKNVAIKCSEEVYSDEALENLKIET